MNTLDYFLKANLYGLLFVGSYWLLLRRHTFFGLNRLYLLASAILSLALPFVSLPTQTVETLPMPIPLGIITLPVGAVAVDTATMASVAASPNWEKIGLMAYALIALSLAIRFLIRTTRLLRLIRQSPRHTNGGYVLVQPNNPTIPTFSFFCYVILNPTDTHNELIIQHELVHVRQYHSADVLSLNLLRAIFWACPALWLIDHLLRQVHEFLADKPARKPTEYARFLVEYSFGIQPGLSGPDTLTNSFLNPSLLKQRIIMLHQTATTRWALGKYALVLPLAFSLLAMTTAREEIADIIGQTTDETITVSGRVTSVDGKPLPGANVVVATSGKGTPTDQNGFYKLSNVSVSATLAFSHIGYRTDVLLMDPLSRRVKNHQLTLSPKLTPNLQDELPPMGASAAYKAIKLNPAMPVRTPPSSETVNGKILTAVEEPAVFPTGVIGLMQYVAQNLRYPAKAKAAGIQGDVHIVFTVLPTGAVSDAKVNKNIKRIGGGCEEEAIRIVSQMPKWIPAQQNSKAVSVRYQIPIRFELEKKEDKRTGQIEPTIAKPTVDELVDIPTMRDVNYPHQPILTMTKVPAKFFNADTVPLPGLMQKPNTSVTIRGKGPLGQLEGDPLYIIDGVELPKNTPKPISGLSPNTIESVSVLKGESAAGTYGEKGKDGVIIITTKKK